MLDNRNIMLSAAGRRVHLMRLLAESLVTLGVKGQVIASDISPLSSAMQASRRRELVARVGHPDCLPTMLELVRRDSIFLIVPTIDTELMFYAQHRGDFAAQGCHINISDPDTIELSSDKRQTHAFLSRHGIPTPRQWTPEEFQRDFDPRLLPVIAKPLRGSASIGVRTIGQSQELSVLSSDMVIQALAPGREYTVDVYLDATGACRCAVPRLRLETRGGEVSKAVTVRHPQVAALARDVATRLPGARGVLNIQMFYDDASSTANVIEVNPRFAGGYPLSHQAGAPMTTWLIEESLGLPCSAQDELWREGVVMLRYDDAVFVNADAVGLTHLRRANAPGTVTL